MINFRLNRLIVLKNEKELYNEKFHKGINVIRGDNTVGKSTLLELIFFGLGGEIKEDAWIYPAYECDKVVIEVYFNEKLFTLSRKIGRKNIPPISIKESEYYVESDWMTFGPRRSENRMSFSQFIFDLMSWQNYKTDEYANLTMHQILRMLYIDQESNSLKLFRTESTNADNESLRLAIAEFLLGLDDLETYKTRQDLLKKEKYFEKTKNELNAIIEILGKDAEYTNELFDQEIIDLNREIQRINNKKIEILNDTSIDNSVDEVRIKELSMDISDYANKVSKYETLQSQLTVELLDCEEFSESLEFRKKSLVESKEITKAFGFVQFVFCPSCNSKIEKETNDNEVCPLCKTKHENKDVEKSYLEVLTELDFQEKQNTYSISQFQSHLKEVKSQLKSFYNQINIKKQELKKYVQFSTRREQELSELSQNVGFIESQIKMLEEKKAIIYKLNDLRSRNIILGTEIHNLNNKLNALIEKNKDYKLNVLNKISSVAKSIIETDLDYEELFKNASKCTDEIDFAKDRWLLDDRVKFSGSANYIKKNSFHLSCLYNSIKNSNFRYPRFLILDDIENGGMKESRSKNFQRSILNLLKDEDDYQLIFATAMIDESLDKDQYTIGKFYEKGDYVLKV